MIQEDPNALLQTFLETFKNPKELTLNKYTGTGEKRDDFTYWVEWKLDFGGIRGGSSYKFGIYKCNEKPKERKGYNYDETTQYAWVENYGKTYNEAFDVVKKNITEIVEIAKKSPIEYDKIEEIKLGDAYKWKIAFLYSNYGLVPVYQKEALEIAANRIGIFPENGEKRTIAELQKNLMDYYQGHKNEYSNDICEFGRYVWRIGTLDLSQSNQVIKYGAPGTGKTYSVEKETREFFDIWKMDARNASEKFEDHYEFVQFHPSYTYEDFIEGIKPVINKTSNQTELKLKNGIFKAFCKKAAKYELWLLENKLLQKNDLNNITIKDIKGKENCPIKYPTETKDDKPISKYIPPYFFVIDEINRADLSRVFGELMYCLEYRGYKGRIKTQYSELEEGDTIFYEEDGQHYFFIPNNVYIIGTMNTIDRSIESFDFALRRRFLWQRVEPDETVLQDHFTKEGILDFADIVTSWKDLNKKIENDPLLGQDYQIGHSYLMKLDKYPNCTMSSYRDIIWAKHIQPILEEYYRGTGDAKSKIDEYKKVFIPQKKK